MNGLLVNFLFRNVDAISIRSVYKGMAHITGKKKLISNVSYRDVHANIEFKLPDGYVSPKAFYGSYSNLVRVPNEAASQ